MALYVCVHFSCFLRGFYGVDDTVAIALILHSCLFCDDDCYHDGNQALVRESTPPSLHGSGNHTKQKLLAGVIC